MEISQNQDFDGSIKIFDLPFSFTFTTLRFLMQKSFQKNKPVVTKKLDSENLENPSEKHLLEKSRCWNFDARIKKLIWHSNCTLHLWSFHIRFFSKKINIQTPVMENNPYEYRVKWILKHTFEFSHHHYLDNSSLFSYTTLRFPMHTLLEKKVRDDGVFWLRETR